MEVFLHSRKTCIGDIDAVKVAKCKSDVKRKMYQEDKLHEQHHSDHRKELPVQLPHNAFVQRIELFRSFCLQKRVVCEIRIRRLSILNVFLRIPLVERVGTHAEGSFGIASVGAVVVPIISGTEIL